MQTATQPEAAFAAAARAQASKIMTGSLRWPALVLAWMSFAIAKVDASEPDHAVLWTGSMTPARAAYESEVIKLALERSRDEYGPFTFSASDKLLSTERLERLIQQGEMVNVVSSPVWDLESGGHSVLQVLPYPISKGLLGYRELVVRRDALPLFASIRTVEQLRELTAGLGNNWTELDVFQASNLHWYGGRDIPQLLSMLSRGRIDYVPLGTMEVREALNDSQHRDQLAIVPGLVLYYPLPVFIQVSTGQPHLAERLELGLQRITTNGSLDALFRQYYGDFTRRLQREPVQVITLPNPNLPEFVEERSPLLLQH